MAAISSPTSVSGTCRAAKAAARGLAATSSAVKDAALLAMASALEARTPEILEANARDMEAGIEPKEPWIPESYHYHSASAVVENGDVEGAYAKARELAKHPLVANGQFEAVAAQIPV